MGERDQKEEFVHSFASGGPCCHLSPRCLHNGPFRFGETKKYLMILKSRTYESIS